VHKGLGMVAGTVQRTLIQWSFDRFSDCCLNRRLVFDYQTQTVAEAKNPTIKASIKRRKNQGWFDKKPKFTRAPP